MMRHSAARYCASSKLRPACVDTARHFIYLSVDAARPLETPISHKDPFDEMLLVQAQEEGLKLLTVDGNLIEHPLVIRA